VGFTYSFISSKVGVQELWGGQLGVAGAEPRSPVPDPHSAGD